MERPMAKDVVQIFVESRMASALHDRPDEVAKRRDDLKDAGPLKALVHWLAVKRTQTPLGNAQSSRSRLADSEA